MAAFYQFITHLEEDCGEQGKGKPFEAFGNQLLEYNPEWSKNADKVWPWDDYPNQRRRQELRTDLSFRDNESLGPIYKIAQNMSSSSIAEWMVA